MKKNKYHKCEICRKKKAKVGYGLCFDCYKKSRNKTNEFKQNPKTSNSKFSKFKGLLTGFSNFLEERRKKNLESLKKNSELMEVQLKVEKQKTKLNDLREKRIKRSFN